MYQVLFRFEDPAIEPLPVENIPPGYSIAEVALTMGIELNHKCGMVCACSTCHIYVTSGASFLDGESTRESEFLQQALSPNTCSRLACQSILLPGEGVLEIIIPDQRAI